MRHRSFLACLLLLLASPAFAAGVNVAWDGCLGDLGAVSLRTFACDRNTGQDLLYVSFVPAVSFPVIQVIEIALDIRTRSGMPLSAWWDVRSPEGCRRDQFGADPVQPSSAPGCEGWSPAPSYFTSRFDFRVPTPNAARLVVSAHGIRSGVLAGEHRLACRIVLRHPNTIGSSSCAGCLEPVDITVSAVRIATLTSEQVLTQPQTNARALWQQDQPTATHSSSWGALKSLYR